MRANDHNGVDVRPSTRSAGWPFWTTTGWGLLVVGVAVALTAMAIAVTDSNPSRFDTDGQFLAMSFVTMAFGCTALLVLLAVTRRGPSLREYFARGAPRPRRILSWLLAAIGVQVVFAGLAALVDHEAPPFVERMIATTDPLLLCLAFVVAAPVFEEAFFRGFLLHGWSRSRLGARGAIILTALLWAAIHTQYGAFELVWLFIYGLLLGVARYRADTLVVPLAMHAGTNALALTLALTTGPA